MSYAGYLLEESYSSSEMQSVYSRAPADWVIFKRWSLKCTFFMVNDRLHHNHHLISVRVTSPPSSSGLSSTYSAVLWFGRSHLLRIFSNFSLFSRFFRIVSRDYTPRIFFFFFCSEVWVRAVMGSVLPQFFLSLSVLPSSSGLFWVLHLWLLSLSPSCSKRFFSSLPCPGILVSFFSLSNCYHQLLRMDTKYLCYLHFIFECFFQQNRC